MRKRWQCSVCSYVHEGDAPPDTCPVCGADRTHFSPAKEGHTGFLAEMVTAFRLHPVLAHFPNGLTPTAFFFLGLWLFTGQQSFEAAAFFLIPILTAIVPFSIGSGLHDWRKYFAGQRAPVFFRKIALAIALLLLSLAAIALRYGQPDLLSAPGWQRWAYGTCLVGMLACVTLLGHFGSLLAARVAEQQDPGRPAEKSPAVDRSDSAWKNDIVTQASDAIMVADPQGIIRLWNRGAEHIFELPASKAVGQSLDLIIPENLRQHHWQGWGEVIRSGASRYGENEMLKVPALRGDGSRFSAEFSLVVLRNTDREITGIAAILRDVTTQWEREQALKKHLPSEAP